MRVPIYSDEQLNWKFQNRPVHLTTIATEFDKHLTKNLLRIKTDEFWSPTLDGNVK